MGAECEGVTAGEGTWWPELLSLVITADSVFTEAVADLKKEKIETF